MEKKIEVRLDEELKEKFMTITKEKHINASSLIRGWIKDYVEKNEEK